MKVLIKMLVEDSESFEEITGCNNIFIIFKSSLILEPYVHGPDYYNFNIQRIK